MNIRQIVASLVIASLLLTAGCSALNGGGGGGGGNATTGTTAATETAASTAEPTTDVPVSTETGTPAATPTATAATSTAMPTSMPTQAPITTGGGTTVAGPSLTLTNTPSGTNNDQYYLNIFETALSQSNFEVVSLETQGNTVVLSYTSTATTQSGIGYEVGFISGLYAELVRQGWDVDRLDVTAVTSTGEPVATYHVESSWARQYNTGALSNEEFIRLVFGTIETSSNGTVTTAETTATV